MYSLLLSIPIITGTIAVLVFMWSFYGIKYNQFCVKPNRETNYFPIIGALTRKKDKEKEDGHT
jgi:alpha-1,3-glucan synthase